MESQITIIFKNLSTSYTNIWSLTSMLSHMNWQVTANCEAFSTCAANIRFFTSVGPSDMNCQITRLYEIFPTCCANIWPFTCVLSSMPFKCRHVLKTFSTGLAGERFLNTVCCYVNRQLITISESWATWCANKGFVICVDPYMLLKWWIIVKSTPAGTASIFFLTFVAS